MSDSTIISDDDDCVSESASSSHLSPDSMDSGDRSSNASDTSVGDDAFDYVASESADESDTSDKSNTFNKSYTSNESNTSRSDVSSEYKASKVPLIHHTVL